MDFTTLVHSWSPPKTDTPDVVDRIDQVSIKLPDIEKSNLIDALGWMTGRQLHALIDDHASEKKSSESVDNFDLDTLLILRPILIVGGDNPMITGDVQSSVRHIRRMNLESSYPVILVKKPVVCDELVLQMTPVKKAQLQSSQSQPSRNRLTKGDISRLEAEKLGISPAALRQRKHRERLKSLTHEKKQP